MMMMTYAWLTEAMTAEELKERLTGAYLIQGHGLSNAYALSGYAVDWKRRIIRCIIRPEPVYHQYTRLYRIKQVIRLVRRQTPAPYEVLETFAYPFSAVFDRGRLRYPLPLDAVKDRMTAVIEVNGYQRMYIAFEAEVERVFWKDLQQR